MIGWAPWWKWAVAWRAGELSQQPTCPQLWHTRRCTQSCRPAARQSTHPVESGAGSVIVSRWVQKVSLTVRLRSRGGGSVRDYGAAAGLRTVRPPLAAEDALRVGGEQAVACPVVETGRHGAERVVEVVEGPVHGVDGEIAGEHAAVDAEGLYGVLEPRGQGVGSHGPERHGQARQLARDVGAQAGQGGDALFPQGAL